MKKNIHLLWIGLMASFLVMGCKTRKNITDIKDVVQNSQQKPSDISIQENSFDWFDAKFNAEINNDGKNNSVKGRVKIRKDSLIWIQIKPDVAIIEAFRIRITPDSVQLVDYINKKYMLDKFSAVKEFIQFDVSFNMIQNIFVGNPTFVLNVNDYLVSVNKENQTILSSSDFKSYVDARSASQPAKFLFQAIWIKDKVHTRNLVYDPSTRIELDLQYQEFQMIDSTMFPKVGQVTVIGDTTNTRFNFTYTKTELHIPTEFVFSIPETYQRFYLTK